MEHWMFRTFLGSSKWIEQSDFCNWGFCIKILSPIKRYIKGATHLFHAPQIIMNLASRFLNDDGLWKYDSWETLHDIWGVFSSRHFSPWWCPQPPRQPGMNIVTKLGLLFALVVVFTLFSFYLGLFMTGPGLDRESQQLVERWWNFLGDFHFNWKKSIAILIEHVWKVWKVVKDGIGYDWIIPESDLLVLHCRNRGRRCSWQWIHYRTQLGAFGESLRGFVFDGCWCSSWWHFFCWHKV